MSSMEPILRLDSVTKEFDTAAGPLRILDNLSLSIAPGESIAIIGPSGSGKSTLLNLLGSLDHPTRGRVTLAGRDLTALDETQLAAVRNRQIGLVFQSHHLLPQCTVLENVLLPTLAANSAAPADALQRAARLLDRVGLTSRLDHRPAQLSGGERQRVAVVRALINQPQLLLADEPTGALDQSSATQLGQLLVEMNREEAVTLIVVTHSQELAFKMKRVLKLEEGRLVQVN
ncbi:MAG: ABC transporter ATP-binding protein [Pedosphaera sp.]|nr:ABC transporter ATP-binding protein [Pedosphaera sp.]